MSLSPAGASISSSEVTNIEAAGFWLLYANAEYFVPFDDYPAFRQATIAQIFDLQILGPGQLHWPELDLDIEIEALESPENFPLQFS